MHESFRFILNISVTSLNLMSILPSPNLGSSSSQQQQQHHILPPNLLDHGSNHLPPNLTEQTPPSAPGSSKKEAQVVVVNKTHHHNGNDSGSGSGSGSGRTSAGGKKARGVNGNHLLNFHYDPISRPHPHPRNTRTRTSRRTKPYNKDLFLQANYKFVLLHPTSNPSFDSIDPDKMLQWEDIICLKYFTPHPATCPICLDQLLCPQMTSCGHIFCFPCILRYFFINQDDQLESLKKCPLCFMMISSKDLYTIYIENVKQHCVGDVIEFMLLTRDKDSLTLTPKQKASEEEAYDAFSKFTFTTDVELQVRKAMSELDSWLARAESGLVDDLERLPYVCTAMEKLAERNVYWKEKRNVDSFHKGSPPNLSFGIDEDTSEKSLVSSLKSVNVNDPSLNQIVAVDEANDGQGAIMSSSYDDDSKGVHLPSDSFTDNKMKGSYDFYQAADGQHLILHPLSMKCLLHHYGSYDRLPQRISGKILQLETITQSEATRRRYRYLSHFPLTTTFQLCEIDLSGILPPSSLSPFEDELKNREKQRKRVARKEHEEKIKAEAAAARYVPVVYDAQPSYDYSPTFSLEDFEALGSSSSSSSSSRPPTVVDRPLFSNVTRLGFAAAHDSPTLRTEEASVISTGLQTGGTSSFANVISRSKQPVEVNKASETGKKGKKGSRVLLSTSGGRRY
ncbi:hypothetical protein QVD17_11189 [Tagetes erecta]|uniref:RING-type domain-containing protein n=1 Tax=Tagetes erecta TaxID=13708 RepID=A0AAD8KSZ4_TARER|nr:hypothetical protein QVD17_11189 [Tagetes erecta]